MRMKISPVNRENYGAAEQGPLQPFWDPPQWDFGVGPAEQEESAAGEHKITSAEHLGTPVCWRRSADSGL